MPREKEGFHEQLEALYELFGRDRAMIPLQEAAAYVGADKRTLMARRDFPLKKIGRCYRVPLVALARWLC